MKKRIGKVVVAAAVVTAIIGMIVHKVKHGEKNL